MKLHFEPDLDYQKLAIESVADLFRGQAARKMGQATREALDPGRAYREAQKAHEDTPTVANKIRLAQAAMRVLARPRAIVLNKSFSAISRMASVFSGGVVPMPSPAAP